MKVHKVHKVHNALFFPSHWWRQHLSLPRATLLSKASTAPSRYASVNHKTKCVCDMSTDMESFTDVRLYTKFHVVTQRILVQTVNILKLTSSRLHQTAGKRMLISLLAWTHAF